MSTSMHRTARGVSKGDSPGSLRWSSGMKLWKPHFLMTALLVAIAWPRFASAVDGCEVLLCMASSNWRSISQCVPPMQQVLRDLSRGKPFPVCPMAGAGNSAEHSPAYAPANCPPQYTHVIELPSGPRFRCDYSGAISVSVGGALFSRTWWSMSGDTVTEFSQAAKAQLGRWDTRFDDDHAAWLSAKPAPLAADADR